MNLNKVCKKNNISQNEAKEMIVSHHELESLLSKKEIKLIKNIEFPMETLQWIKKTSQDLKISQDAVISGILKIQLNKLNK